MLRHLQRQRQSAASDFFERCSGLFLGFEAGHMGSDMYHDHAGQRTQPDENGVMQVQPMSGVLAWDGHAKTGTIPRVEKEIFLTAMRDIATMVEPGLALVELGPGSAEDTQALLRLLRSPLYVPVDNSPGILSQAESQAEILGCRVEPRMLDMFAAGNAPVTAAKSLGILSGCTIGNIAGPAPKSRLELRGNLVRALRNITRLVPSGSKMVISVRADEDGTRTQALYNEAGHRLFGVNFLYRMQEEFAMENFDPDGFEYHPVWHEPFNLLAHTVRATRSQDFTMADGGEEIMVSVKAGDRFHYNNSYNYPLPFFESCAAEAGLTFAKPWLGDYATAVYLFEAGKT